MATTSTFSISAFQAKYKYRVGGVEDALLRSVGGLIKDEHAFKLFKSSRQAESNTIAALATSEPDPVLRTAAAAKARLPFLEKSGRILNDLSIKGETKAKTMAPAISKTASDINTMINDYITSTADSPEDQTAFLNRAQALVDKLQRVVVTQKGKLRSEDQIFNVSILNASRMLATAETAITAQRAVLSGGASSMTSGGGTDGGGVDITV